MRPFLQKKAGATYFANSGVTVNVRKHNMEYIFALKGGWHAVISLSITQDGVFIMANLGNITEQLEKILPKLKLKPEEHKQFTDILEGKSEYTMMSIDLDGNGLTSGITKQLDVPVKPHLQILGDPTVQKEASKLFELAFDTYWDLRKSPYPELQSLSDYFYDR